MFSSPNRYSALDTFNTSSISSKPKSLYFEPKLAMPGNKVLGSSVINEFTNLGVAEINAQIWDWFISPDYSKTHVYKQNTISLFVISLVQKKWEDFRPLRIRYKDRNFHPIFYPNFTTLVDFTKNEKYENLDADITDEELEYIRIKGKDAASYRVFGPEAKLVFDKMRIMAKSQDINTLKQFIRIEEVVIIGGFISTMCATAKTIEKIEFMIEAGYILTDKWDSFDLSYFHPFLFRYLWEKHNKIISFNINNISLNEPFGIMPNIKTIVHLAKIRSIKISRKYYHNQGLSAKGIYTLWVNKVITNTYFANNVLKVAGNNIDPLVIKKSILVYPPILDVYLEVVNKPREYGSPIKTSAVCLIRDMVR